tara:strand:+ start:238 stop:915 length:678 start_codon:yes stop_codon:yes gene_type:complete
MVKFIEFDTDPEIESKELDHELDIINSDVEKIEDMKVSPFIQKPSRIKKPAFKPEPPQQEDIEKETDTIKEEDPTILKVKSIKPKKPLSEKQLAHLERMRKKKIEKTQTKIEKTIKKNDITKSIDKPDEITEEELLEMEESEFDNWLKYMDKFDKMMKAINKEKDRKENERLQKEKEIEDRIRKKIETEYQQKHNINNNNKLEHHVPILQQPTNDYGEFAGMFGY